MKIQKLSGAQLDYWVARSEGMTHDQAAFAMAAHSYSSSWVHGGPIIERDQIYLEPPHDAHYHGGPNAGWKRFDEWQATVSARTRTWSRGPDDAANMVGGRVGRGAGPTPLVAAMREKVASHYGDEVSDEGTP